MRNCLAAVLWAAALAVCHAVEGEQLPVGPFAIRAPDMNIPAGTKRGMLRRIMQPFGPWTLICDENLASRTRVCNVSQTLVDSTGRTVFSWSLAASQSGAPVFVLRLPAAFAGDHFVQVIFGRQKPIEAGVILSLCDAMTCLGYLNVDARIQRQIATQANVVVKILVGTRTRTFEPSLDGLKQAVASLK